MEFVETTISEHIFNQGIIKGRIEGEINGEIKGEIKLLEKLYKQGVLSETQFKKRISPLRRKLEKLTSST
jgi:hypothetical protein